MKQIFVVYDDSRIPGKEVRTITGEKTFGETIFKRVTLKDRIQTQILKEKQVKDVFYYRGRQDEAALFAALPLPEENVTVVHLYSNFGIAEKNEFSVLLKKAEYMNENFSAYCGGEAAMHFLVDGDVYKRAFQALVKREFEAEEITNRAFTDLSVRTNFLSFITGGFDARFFNALEGDAYTVTKRSGKKEKIRAEYEFYYLLPDRMKMWFVMPYDYKEDEKGASYTMERFHMTDIAVRFVHGAVDTAELKDILDKLFYFIRTRETKPVEEAEGRKTADALYIRKLSDRMEELRGYREYSQFDNMIRMGTEYQSIDDITARYEKLYQRLSASGRRSYRELSVGHGDLCFSNILYSKEAEVLKLIDPKGAMKKEELYTDPYYDLAKLSHSVCGCYDFFNNGLYDISLKRDLCFELTVDTDAEPCKEIFGKYLQDNGFDYGLVRLYEAGLFLSMLPYHMDQPGKVFGFLLNAVKILDEVEACTKN